jgi:hypothetical protein
MLGSDSTTRLSPMLTNLIQAIMYIKVASQKLTLHLKIE